MYVWSYLVSLSSHPPYFETNPCDRDPQLSDSLMSPLKWMAKGART